MVVLIRQRGSNLASHLCDGTGMKRPFRSVRVFAVVLLVAGIAVTGAAGRSHSNAVSVTDPTGDSGTAADVTTVAVSNDDNGVITLQVSLPNRATADQLGDEVVGISIDNDPNATNDRSGFGEGDIALFAFSDGVAVARFQGGTFVPFDAPSLRVSYSSGPTFTFNRADFGISSRFAFFVQIFDQNASVQDSAPDGSASYVYAVTIGPPPLAAGPVTAAPTAPIHGRAFSLRMPVTRTDNNTPLPDDGVTVTCTAQVRGKTLRGRGSYAGGVASCTFGIPKASRGKSFKATVTVRFQGATVSKTFVSRIR